MIDQGVKLSRYGHVRMSVCFNANKSLSFGADLMKLGTGPSFCYTQYICWNRQDRITKSYSCHRNDRVENNI